jgi:5-keto-L-gluconate epimerase
MKLSISAATQTVMLPQIVFKGDLEEVLHRAAEAGFKAVDLFLTSPDEAVHRRLKDSLRRFNVEVALLSPLGRLLGQGITFTHPDRKIRQLFFEHAREHLSLAAELHSFVPVGFSRGRRQETETAEDYRQRLIEGLCRYDELAASIGAELVLEPINRYEINSVNTAAQALGILRECGLSHTGLLLDLFHMNIEESSFAAALTACAPHIKHVHFSDSNRQAPGLGHSDLQQCFMLLESLGYTGYYGIEILPLPDPESAARFALAYMQMLQQRSELRHIVR